MGVFLKCNKQYSYFPLNRIMKLVIGYRFTIFRPLSAQSLFLLFPLSLKMSLSKYPPLLHFQQYFIYTMGVSIYRQKKPDAPDTLTKSNYTSTPCHGHKSSAQRLTVLPWFFFVVFGKFS